MNDHLPNSLDHCRISLTESMTSGRTDNIANVSGVISFDPAELSNPFQWLPTGPPPGIIDVIVPTVYRTVFLGEIVLGVVVCTTAERKGNEQEQKEHVLLGECEAKGFIVGAEGFDGQKFDL